jgi:hypothetical protein
MTNTQTNNKITRQRANERAVTQKHNTDKSSTTTLGRIVTLEQKHAEPRKKEKKKKKTTLHRKQT